MKKTLLIIGITGALFSCKKTTTKEFTATDITGLGTVKGTITKPVTVRTTAGTAWNTIQEPAVGVEVSVRILNKDLYINNSNAQGAKNYYGTTDANGNYAIQAKCNEQGSPAVITIPDIIGTADTIVAGTRKTGLAVRFNGNNPGTATNKTIVAATETNFPFTYAAGVLIGGNGGDQQVGTALFNGAVYYGTVRAFTSASGSLTTIGTYSVAAANTNIYLTYSNDPTTLVAKTYTTTTDISGKYSFTVSSHATNTSNAQLRLPDFVHTQDTTVYSNGSFTTITTPAKTGKAGFFNGFSPATEFNVIAGEVRHNDYIYGFGTFTAY